MEMVEHVAEEIPTDDEVLALVGIHEGGIDPTELLSALLASGHTRPNSQRAMQRCLDRGKIRFD